MIRLGDVVAFASDGELSCRADDLDRAIAIAHDMCEALHVERLRRECEQAKRYERTTLSRIGRHIKPQHGRGGNVLQPTDEQKRGIVTRWPCPRRASAYGLHFEGDSSTIERCK